jgi:cytochrome b6-f complex iron-sulfur subunit
MVKEQTSLTRDTSRRNFLNWFLGTTTGVFALSVLYPLSRYLIPPQGQESSARTVTLSVKPQELKSNSGQIFRFGSQPAILIDTASGELKAFSATCTHLGCIVQYRSDLSQIWCACHNGHFDLNGKNVEGPPPKPLEEYAVNVRGDQIIVSKKG